MLRVLFDRGERQRLLGPLDGRLFRVEVFEGFTVIDKYTVTTKASYNYTEYLGAKLIIFVNPWNLCALSSLSWATLASNMVILASSSLSRRL